MTGQVHDRASGVQALLTRGQGHLLEGTVGAEGTAANDLPDGAAPERSRRHLTVRREDVEIVLAAEWLEDLHDPSLVISHGYVGPDRRRRDRTPPGYGRADLQTGRAGRLVRIARTACVTVVIVVPLTLMAARSFPLSSTGTAIPAATIGPLRFAGTAGASRLAIRAEAVRQRAPARQQVVAGTPGGSATQSTVQAEDASAATGQLAQAAPAAQTRVAAQRQAVRAGAAAQSAAAQADAAQRRALAHAAAAQRRALAHAAAAQRRALARAAAQAAAAQAAAAQAAAAQAAAAQAAAAQAAAAQTAAAQAAAARVGSGGHRPGGAAVPLPSAT